MHTRFPFSTQWCPLQTGVKSNFLLAYALIVKLPSTCAAYVDGTTTYIPGSRYVGGVTTPPTGFAYGPEVETWSFSVPEGPRLKMAMLIGTACEVGDDSCSRQLRT